jgi:hypothetical protein
MVAKVFGVAELVVVVAHAARYAAPIENPKPGPT